MRSPHLALAAVAALTAAARLGRRGRRGSAASDPEWLTPEARARYEKLGVLDAILAADREARREVSPEPEPDPDPDWLTPETRARYEKLGVLDALLAAHRDARPQSTLPAPSRPRRTRPQSTLPAPSRPRLEPSATQPEVALLLQRYRASVERKQASGQDAARRVRVSDAVAKRRLAMLPREVARSLLNDLSR